MPAKRFAVSLALPALPVLPVLLVLLALSAAAAFAPAPRSHAESSVTLSQACAWEQNIDIFITGYLEPQSLNCRISGHAARISDYGYIADSEVAVRTTILIDASALAPKTVRENVLTLVSTLIDRIGKNEKLKIVASGDATDVLSGFSADKNALAAAIGGLAPEAPEASDSGIYDALYGEIPTIRPIGDTPCYHRAILVSGGINDTASNITRGELYNRLQGGQYPIAAVAASPAALSEPDKDISALARLSGGKYYELNAQTAIEDLSSYLSADGLFWMRAAVPVDLLDGTVRQVEVSDGAKTLIFDIKAPVFGPGELQTPQSDDGTGGGAAAQTPSASPQPAGSPLRSIAIAVAIGAGVGAAIAITAVAAKPFLRERIGRLPFQWPGKEESGPPPDAKKEAPAPPADPCSFIRLRDIGNVGQIWEIEAADSVLVGRDASCQVRIDENSVARRQCRIRFENAAILENLSNTNATRLNGEILHAPEEIRVGDLVKCGRVALAVDDLIIYGADSSDSLSDKTVFLNL